MKSLNALRVNAQGNSPVLEKLKSIVTFPEPSNLCQLSYYLSMLNFFLQFQRKIVKVLLPLTAVLESKHKLKN